MIWKTWHLIWQAIKIEKTTPDLKIKPSSNN